MGASASSLQVSEPVPLAPIERRGKMPSHPSQAVSRSMVSFMIRMSGFSGMSSSFWYHSQSLIFSSIPKYGCPLRLEHQIIHPGRKHRGHTRNVETVVRFPPVCVQLQDVLSVLFDLDTLRARRCGHRAPPSICRGRCPDWTSCAPHMECLATLARSVPAEECRAF